MTTTFITRTTKGLPAFALALALLATACGTSNSTDSNSQTIVGTAADSSETSTTTGESDTGPAGGSSTFTAEVWADNWFALYINGVLVGEDSVPITTERSFNAETISFEAAYPLTIAIEAKDFKETDSGLEYIGEGNQQMGDGGLIAQITDDATGEVVAVTSSAWSALVVHQAPLNTDCEDDGDPDATCEFEITDTPAGWTEAAYDDSGWQRATEWTEADVGPKDGYDEIAWDSTAQLIWGPNLEVDNTILLRLAIAG